MIYRELGRTGERVSAIGLGGWHLSLKHVDEELPLGGQVSAARDIGRPRP